MSTERRTRSLARFDGRTAVVTGGGRGIGRAIAVALSAEGAHVAIVARTPEQCRSVAAEIGSAGLAVPADVRSAEDCERVIRHTSEWSGTPSLLVNAAGISPVRGPFERQDAAAFEQILAVNVLGAVSMCHAAAEALAESGGAVVNVASVLGVAGSPLLSAYGASKAALIQFTRTLAREWGGVGVRVNALCPGYIETELTARMLAKRPIMDEIVGQTPMRRLPSMDEVVDPALFLASGEASFITGTALIVDGGFAA
ncbi:MAG TPA: glucose 1-dehydrogenase [Solirubrobacteraceae bacterium]